MKITAEIVAKMCEKEMQELLDRKIEHDQLKLVLAAYDGKRITSRSKIAPFRFADGSIYGKYRHFFKNPVDVKTLDYSNRCNNNKERIANLEKLDIEKTAQVFAQIQEGFELILDGFWQTYMLNLDAFHNPIFYDLTRLIEGEDKDINLNHLYTFRRKRE